MNATAIRAVVLVVAMGFASPVSGCSTPPQSHPFVTPEPEAATTTTPAPAETPDPTAPAGTRENPVPVGQMIAFSADSAFQVGASGAPEVSPYLSVLPLVIQIDWMRLNAQAETRGQPTGGPVQPYLQFGVSFVNADGKSYNKNENQTVNIGGLFSQAGDVYEGTDTIIGNSPVSFPAAELADGVWVVEDRSSGERVFIAAQ